jgi:hypothetical protein
VLGEEGGREATLVWSNGVSERFTSLPQDPAWRKICVRNSTLIKPRRPSLEISVDHLSPALTSEYFPLSIAIENCESCDVQDLAVAVALSEESTAEGQTTAELYLAVPHTPTIHHNKQSLELSCGSLSPGAKFSETVYLSTHTVGERMLTINASYGVQSLIRAEWGPVTCVCQKSYTFPVTTIKPFDVTYKLMNTKFKAIDVVNFDEPFVLVTEIHCLSPWKLYIDNTSFHLPHNVKNVGSNSSQIKGLELGSQDKASEVWCLLAPLPHSHITQPQNTSLSFGTYTVQWRRASADPQSSVMTSTVTLPSIPTRNLSLSISTDIPASGTLHQPFPISYIVHNRSQMVQEVEVRISTSDAFMYSGKRHSRFQILPSTSHTLTYNLYPVVAGMVSLPHLDLSYQRDPKVVELATDSQLPSSVFIKPSSICRELETDLPSLSSSLSTSTHITTA